MIDIREKLAGRGPAIAAGSAAALVLAALAWVLCTQPLAPAGAVGSGSTEAPAAAASEKEPAAEKGKADEGKKAAADKDSKDDKGEQKKDATPAAKEGKQPDAAGAAKSDSDKAASQTSAPPSGGATAPAQKPSGSGGGSKPVPAPQASQPETQEPAPAPQPAPKPQHQHSWQAVYRDEPVYEQQWVSNWVEEFDYRQERWECSACGKMFEGSGGIDDHIWGTYGDPQHPKGASAIDQSYDVYKKVDKGSYQTVQTGTKQVLDHHACSCGAVK